MGDDLRASDREREAAVLRLRADHLEGRLTVEELEERVARAHAAITVGDLAALQTDLPARRHVPAETTDGVPWWPGVRSFNQRMLLVAGHDVVYEEALAHLVPALESRGYVLDHVGDDVLILVRARGARDQRVTIRLRPAPDGHTLLIAHGVASLGVRRAFAKLRD